MSQDFALIKEKETLFITLYAKATDFRSGRSILEDEYASQIIEKSGIDFSKYKDFGNTVIVVRAKQFDEWVKTFIKNNPDAVIVYCGCGLDTRIKRINPSKNIDWFDIDYPEVISLRKKFFSDSENYKMISSSITDSEWINQIPAGRPTLIIAEGVFEYLSGVEVKAVLNRLTDYFSRGEIIFDVMSSFAIRSGKEKLKKTTGAVHKWAVDDPTEVDKLNQDMTRLESIQLFKSVFIKQFSFGLRILLTIAGWFRGFRNMMLLLRYRF